MCEKPKMTLEDYLFENGVGFPVSEYMLDKLKIPHGLTQRQQKKLSKDAQEAECSYQAKRRKAIEEYNEKVRNGEIIVPSMFEKTLRTARGHPDNAATQAARRMLKKRYGIDYEECP